MSVVKMLVAVLFLVPYPLQADIKPSHCVGGILLSMAISSALTYACHRRSNAAHAQDLFTRIDALSELSKAFCSNYSAPTLLTLVRVDDLMRLRSQLQSYQHKIKVYTKELHTISTTKNAALEQRRTEAIVRLEQIDASLNQVLALLEQQELLVKLHADLGSQITYAKRDLLPFESDIDKLLPAIKEFWHTRETRHGYIGFPYTAFMNAVEYTVDRLHTQIAIVRSTSSPQSIGSLEADLTEAQTVIARLEGMQRAIGSADPVQKEIASYLHELQRLADLEIAKRTQEEQAAQTRLALLKAENARDKIVAEQELAAAQKEQNEINKSHIPCYTQIVALVAQVSQAEASNTSLKTTIYDLQKTSDEQLRTIAEIRNRLAATEKKNQTLAEELSQCSHDLKKWESYQQFLARALPALTAAAASLKEQEGFPHEKVEKITQLLAAISAHSKKKA